MTDLELLHRLTLLLVSRMTHAGHLAQIVTQEHLGVCSVDGCRESCVEARTVLDEAVSRLETLADERPVQAGLGLREVG